MVDDPKGDVLDNKQVDVIIVGKGRGGIYADALFSRWKEIDSRVGYFDTRECFWLNNRFGFFLAKIEDRFSLGWCVSKINRRILKIAEAIHPQVVFLYLDRYISRQTVCKLRKKGIFVITYCNDDPFSYYYPKYFWRKYIQRLIEMDLVYVYRKKNIDDCARLGIKDVRILRSYYTKERNYYIGEPKTREYVPRVVFLGHFEDDERADYINGLVKNGVEVGVPINSVEKYTRSDLLVGMKYSNEDYNEELNAADIALVFLSKINHDDYTRRCFEIPATKTMMMSVYTDDIASMFEADKEIVFFNDEMELVKKIKYYLSNEKERERIAKAGYERLIADGHEVNDRVRQIISDINGRLLRGLSAS